MQIYSWNMLYRNRGLDRAFEFVSKSDFDIFCLQEVPENFLKRLQTLPYAIAYHIEMERLLPSGVSRNYSIILTKHRITSQGEISFPNYWPLLPLRARLFVQLMPSRYFSRIRSRGGHYADVIADGVTVRVVNLHLVQAHPAWRLKELEAALATLDQAKPSVVCGDFNTHSKPYTTLLNWILGGKISDFFFYRRERSKVDETIRTHGLTNPLEGKVTHDFSRSQLDHILISSSYRVTDASVIPERYGSDHHPIRVSIP